jgi:hypothetical protein
VTVFAETGQNWGSCIQDICRDTRGNVPNTARINKWIEEISSKSGQKTLFYRQFGPAFHDIERRLMALRRESTARGTQYLNGEIKSPSELEVYQFNRGLLDTLSFEFNRGLKKSGNRSYFEHFLHSSEFIHSKVYDALTTTERNQILTLLNDRSRAMGEVFDLETFNNSELSDEARLTALAPARSLAKSVKKIAIEMLVTIADIERSPMLSSQKAKIRNVAPSVPLDLIKAVASGKDIPRTQIPTLSEAAYGLAEAKTDLLNRDIIVRTNSLMNALIHRPKLKRILIEKLNEDTATELEISPIDGHLETCASVYALQSALAPTPKQLALGKSTELLARQIVKRTILEKFPSESPEQIERLMETWVFEYPVTNSHIDERFTSLVNNGNDYLKSLRPTMRSRDFLMPVDFIHPFCTDEMDILHSVPDRWVTLQRKIIVGRESIVFPNMGLQVMAHEMGHALSSDILAGNFSPEGTQRFLHTRQCLANKYIDNRSFQTEYSESGDVLNTALKAGALSIREAKFTEEDWADLFAARVLEAVSPSTNMMCALLTPRSEVSMLSTDPYRYHSSNLFRMLHTEQLSRGELPRSCSMTMRQSQNPVNFATCW